MSDIYWTRSNGQKVPIKEMGDYHLLSAIAMMKRNGYVSAADYSLYATDPGPNTDAGMTAFAEERDAAMARQPSTLLDALDTEARTRGLIR